MNERDPRVGPGASNEQLGGGLTYESTAVVRVMPRHEPSAWLRGVAVAALSSGPNPQVCPHLGEDADQIVTTLRRPARYACPDCARQLDTPTVTDRWCDRCGRYTADGVTVLAVRFAWQIGGYTFTVLVMVGLCAACAAREAVPA